MGFFDLDRDRQLLERLNAARQQAPRRKSRHEEPSELKPRGRDNAQPSKGHNRTRPYFPDARGQLLLNLLGEADDLRCRQQSLAYQLRSALAEPSTDDVQEEAAGLTQLRQSWAEFLAQGGITREDLLRFMSGKRLGRNVPAKRHLRLVRTNQD